MIQEILAAFQRRRPEQAGEWLYKYWKGEEAEEKYATEEQIIDAGDEVHADDELSPEDE